MSLLSDIQNDASSSTVRVADLLRKCKLLAHRLKSEEFADWVEQELQGYDDVHKLPPYRVLNGVVPRGDFVGPFGAEQNDVPMPFTNFSEGMEYIQEASERVFLRSRVSIFEDLLSADPDRVFVEPVPENIVSVINMIRRPGWKCVRMYRIIPRSTAIALLDSVRNKVLKFAMEIENENPYAGEADVHEKPISQEKLNTIINNNFYANVGNVAQGSHDFEQNATVAPVAQQLNVDWSALSEQLPLLRERLRVMATKSEDFESLSGVVAATEAIEAKDESKLIAGLKKGGKFALEAAKTIGTDVAAAVIVKALGAT